MKRRDFLTALLAILAASPAAKAWAASPRRGLLIQESPLAGFQYHAGESLWGWMCEGDVLTLAREPQNPYDPKAVRVDWQGRKLGYVPRMENTAVAQMLDRGERLTAHIVRLKDSLDPWKRVWLAVVLEP
jgi:hypothetical protein